MTTTDISAVAARRGALLTTVFVLQFLVALDMSLLNIALPAIRSDLGFSAAGLQWVVTAYLLTFAGFMLLGGRLGDLWGRRPVILAGLTVFGIASIVGGCATTPWVLVTARAAQGIAGAMLAPVSLALVSGIEEPAAKKKAMGIWGGAGAAGGAVGVVLSGILTDWFSWRAVLFVNLPIVAIAVVACLAGVASTRRRTDVTLDIWGAALVTTGVAALVYAVTSSTDNGWSAPSTIIGITVGIVLIAAFVVVERTITHPLMPMRVLGTRSIVGANVFGFMLSAGQLAAFYFCSLYIQTIWGVEPVIAGVLFLPFCAFIVLGIIIAGKLSAAIGTRATLTLLGIVGAVGLALFATMSSEFDFWLGIILPSIFAAIGIGGSLMLIGSAGTSGVAPADAGAASGVLNSSRQLGGSIGLAVLVTIAAACTDIRTGYQAAFAAGAALLVVGSLAAWLILPRVSSTATTATATG
ncbi:MFS transporter [Gordonia soli]|uniref:Putative drug resistance transporter n=1 Tax=Gordonia soli NBRC 108243 TaxID=1223545 RepID=M0QK25_9ACTN|nr:MFS transporter [Gordonia soli]GAC68975.1 putative drug resistance transporter [Gordonia soli NBRC 108243]